jgi:isoaspartyl peptidase/L-asparaginase-like protein (Ntn-hydrolase superfamily)
VIIASERGEVGLRAGMDLLQAGGSAMDAVEAAIRLVESNEADHFVGVGGLPNLLGEVELDASIMDGATRRSGAVGAVTGFPHPISIARAVFDLLPQHVLLVGRGAERFADEVGIERGETLTDEALKMWQERLTAAGLAPAHEAPVPGSVSYSREALEAIQSTALRDGAWGTVNVLALDSAGSLAAGVSTSGYPWKYPGRVGDSPLIGAGNYCDNQIGAAACTGRGELAIRGGTARAVLLALAAGRDPAGACADALTQTMDLPDDPQLALQTLCLTPDGRHGGAASRDGATYGVLTASGDSYAIMERRKA